MSVSITIKNAVKKYGEQTVISGISLHVKDKELFTLLGPSGCGKTTLLRMIAGFNTIEGGEFFFDKKIINDMEVSLRNIGMVFQNYAIFPHYSVRQNVEFGLRNRKYNKKDIQTEADKFLKLVHIFEHRDKKPEQLSGGQLQRVALARALVIKPDVLLMDEPFSSLDELTREKMSLELQRILKKKQKTVLFVTHNIEEAIFLADKVIVLSNRPSKIKRSIKIEIPKPRKLSIKNSNTFRGYEKWIREILKE